MNNLKKSIERFYNSTDILETRMKELSSTILYGGYINIRNQYHIFVRTVEFYYHEEEGIAKDPIMYHRNNNAIEGEVPYYPMLSINSHGTGIDITFENPDEQIRASALIRAYEVWDVSRKRFLVWNAQDQQFKEYSGIGKKYNTQCLYLKSFLTGFPTEGNPDILWVGQERTIGEITPMKRQGVYVSSDRQKYKPIKNRRDEREWAFRREAEI